MDIQLIFIILIFGTLLVMEFVDKENYEYFSNPFFQSKYSSPLVDRSYNPIKYSINTGEKKKGFLNFGTFGNYPPNHFFFTF